MAVALTEEQLRQRDGRLTASRVACLMSGDEAKILNLWREMVGDPEFVEEDLSDVWAVALGSVTEALNLDWYERRSGRPVTRRGEVVISPDANWAAATLDGWDDTVPAPIECKHVGGYERREVVIARYQPQMHWQMIVTGTHRVMLSLIEGTKEPVVEPIDWDAEYGAELWRRAEDFMRHVESLTPPVAIPAVAAPIIAVKELAMDGNNLWVDSAYNWLTHGKNARLFVAAEKELKSMVPADCKRAYGAGIQVLRDRAGRLSVKELK